MSRGFIPFRVLQARVAALVWATRGRRALQRGDVDGAVQALEQAVSWRPHAVRPLLLLARGYLRARDTWRAHRTLAQAREADPVSFARLAPRWLAADGVDQALLTEVLGLGQHPVRVPTAPRTDAILTRAVGPGQLPYGDCRDLDEYAHFRAMPPITPEEIAGTDWDRVLDDLLEE